MPATWVLKIRQVDKPDNPILIHVTQKQEEALDLDLVATDGEDAFRGKVRQRHLSKLKSHNFEGTDKEWIALLHYVLVSRRNSGAEEEQIKNLEVDCSIAGRSARATLSLTLRSRIEDITHKLGAIELVLSDNTDDVDLFGWACQLADRRDWLEGQAMSSDREVDSAKSTISALRTQLDDLIKVKAEHEDQLLTKFVMLLNEKKLKIRNQQRVLQTAKLDNRKLDEMQLLLDGKSKSVESIKRKRSENAAGMDDDSDEEEKEETAADDVDDESDGFDPMDVDRGPQSNMHGDTGLRQQTPSRSDSPETATASEGEDDARQAMAGSSLHSKASTAMEASPPPVRSLPFQRKGQRAARTSKAEKLVTSVTDEDQETESEDDEL